MKKVLLTLSFLGFFSVLCFAQAEQSAQEPAQPADATAIQAPIQVNNFTGQVESAPLAEGEAQKTEITVVDSNGEKKSFLIDKDASILSIDYVTKGDKVNIEYIVNSDGTNAAKTVKKITEQ